MSRQAGAESAQIRVPPVNLPGRELHSPDLQHGTLPPLVSNNLDPIERDPSVIVATDSVFNDGYAEELAFMEETVVIVLYKAREKFAPNIYEFSVQGKAIWIQVDVPTRIKRKYLEVLARSQPYDVTTEVRKNEDHGDQAVVQNFAHRHQTPRHPFTVMEDKNPRGTAWLAKVMRES